MADYFNKYFLQFTDLENNTWRADILDSEGATPTQPYELVGAAEPLVTALLNSSADKNTYILGRQLTISYIYDGGLLTPKPEEFFEAQERRFRVEVRKNSNLYGVYYVRPDYSEEPYLYPPYAVSIQAIDGLAYMEGELFDIYDGSGLDYQLVSLYDALMTRGLSQLLDAGTPVNVLCSLFPDNATGKLLTDIFLHTDMFFSFVSGPSTVRDVLIAFCKAFSARLFLEDGQLWVQRVQDTYQDAPIVTTYTDATTYADSTPPLLKFIGPDNADDGVPVMANAVKMMTPAVKKAQFQTTYKSINVLSNFDWSQFTGSDFTDWVRQPGQTVTREGAGTLADPYRAVLPLDPDPLHNLNQGFGSGPSVYQIRVEPGDILELEIPVEYYNAKDFFYAIDLDTLDNDWLGWQMTGGGGWIEDGAGITVTDRIPVSRSGRKRNGSVTVKTEPIPIPKPNPGPSTPRPTEYRLSFILWGPSELSYHTPLEPGDVVDGPGGGAVKVGPVKVGVIKFTSEGRVINATNQAQFSNVLDMEDFNFIDTGDAGLSNTFFVDPDTPAEIWSTGKPGVLETDIEVHMARAAVDQYPRSVVNWQGTIRGSDLGLKNTYIFDAMPGKRLIILSDSYAHRSCLHEVVMQEVFPEGNASVVTEEYDIEEDVEND